MTTNRLTQEVPAMHRTGIRPADAADEAGRKPATVTGLCAADKFFNIGCNGSIPHGFLIALRTVQLNYIGTTLV